MDHFYTTIDGWFSFPRLYSEMVLRAGDGATFVEVGSWHGCSASYLAVDIINSGKSIKLICVDTWRGDGVYVDYDKYRQDYTNADNTDDGLFRKFLANIEPVQSVITPMRMESVLAAQTFNDNSLDFVYIDASHEYEDIRSDILAWYPKVKNGGFIGGHDYPSWPGVQKAVDELIKESITQQEESWLVEKK